MRFGAVLPEEWSPLGHLIVARDAADARGERARADQLSDAIAVQRAVDEWNERDEWDEWRSERDEQ